MTESFELRGDPASIRSSATVWSTFSGDASEAASDIRSLDTSEFQGDEADTYRGKVNEDLPPHLDTTSEAWGIVSAALSTYASTLEDLQQRMSTLRSTAQTQQQSVSSAQSDLSSAKSADASHAESRQHAAKDLKSGQTLPADTYQAQTGGAQSGLSNAKAALQETINAAATVRAEHTTALDKCCGEIDRAKQMRFAKPPGFWGRLTESVGDWIKDHADILKTISSVLKTISAVAGLLSFIPVLAPIMGPIALVTGGAALLIDVGVKLGTGEGSWTDIGIDGALMILPGAGRLLKTAVNGTKAGASVNRVAAKGMGLLRESKAGRGFAAFRNTKAGALAVTAPGKGLNYVNKKVAQGLHHVPGLNKLPMERVLTIKYKKGWSPEQIAAADQKVAQLDDLGRQGRLTKTSPPPRERKLRERYAESMGMTKADLPKDSQVDHIHELQLGGPDALHNTALLDSSVNASVGPSIMNRIAGDQFGTAYDGVRIIPRR